MKFNELPLKVCGEVNLEKMKVYGDLLNLTLSLSKYRNTNIY